MNPKYSDITSRLGTPIWFDECGVPRYDPFHPSMCNDIYAVEAALLEIACQECGERFSVAVSACYAPPPMPDIASSVVNKTIHYGDPPRHECMGDTMNCDDLCVLEYWHRDRSTGMEWHRDANREVRLSEDE